MLGIMIGVGSVITMLVTGLPVLSARSVALVESQIAEISADLVRRPRVEP